MSNEKVGGPFGVKDACEAAAETCRNADETLAAVKVVAEDLHRIMGRVEAVLDKILPKA